jgi:hypothetical protein
MRRPGQYMGGALVLERLPWWQHQAGGAAHGWCNGGSFPSLQAPAGAAGERDRACHPE